MIPLDGIADFPRYGASARVNVGYNAYTGSPAPAALRLLDGPPGITATTWSSAGALDRMNQRSLDANRIPGRTEQDYDDLGTQGHQALQRTTADGSVGCRCR
jgi:hypothetical protein